MGGNAKRIKAVPNVDDRQGALHLVKEKSTFKKIQRAIRANGGSPDESIGKETVSRAVGDVEPKGQEVAIGKRAILICWPR